MENLRDLCGKSFSGKLASTDEIYANTEFAVQAMTMHVRTCSDTEIRIPFYVGDNRSRTWIVSKTQTGLRLKHRHNHEDGQADAVTLYGGDTITAGTANRQEFPADQFSKDMFIREDMEVSATNIWAVEITADVYAYELRRKGRHFRVEFDLSKEVSTPLPPW